MCCLGECRGWLRVYVGVLQRTRARVSQSCCLRRCSFTCVCLSLLLLAPVAFLARAVSASDKNKHVPMTPLQDNLVELYLWLQPRLPPPVRQALDASFRHEWISIKEKLVALIALGFAAVFDQARRDLCPCEVVGSTLF